MEGCRQRGGYLPRVLPAAWQYFSDTMHRIARNYNTDLKLRMNDCSSTGCKYYFIDNQNRANSGSNNGLTKTDTRHVHQTVCVRGQSVGIFHYSAFCAFLCVLVSRYFRWK